MTKNSVTLSWNKPTNDGGSKVKGYIVQKKPKDAKDWTPVNILPHPDTTFTVPGLDEGQEYEFRVVAVNDVGESPPSKPTGLILVEEQPGEQRFESPLIRDATTDADAAPFVCQLGVVVEPWCPYSRKLAVTAFEHGSCRSRFFFIPG